MATPKAPGQKDAPDPALAGPIRNIVKDAHKWGGNGTHPDFDKIKRVLLTKHPDVIAKAFGGNANQAAAWMWDNWAVLHGMTFQCADGSRSPHCWRNGGKKKNMAEEDAPTPLALSEDADVPETTHQLFFADKTSKPEEDSEGLVWKDVLMTGRWKVHPVHGKGKDFVIDEPYLDRLIQNFDDRAWEHVTVPLSHKDGLLENAGFVARLVKKPHPTIRGRKILRAGLKFTDPAVKEKVLSGSIANVSVGIDEGEVVRPDGKTFSTVLKHLATTNQPWMKGLRPFGDPATMFTASEDEDEKECVTLLLDPDDEDAEKATSNDDKETSPKFIDQIRNFLLSAGKPDEEVEEFLKTAELPNDLTPEDAQKYLAELSSLADEADGPDDEIDPTAGDGTSEASSDSSTEDENTDDNPNDHPQGGEISMSQTKDDKKGDEATPKEDANVITLSQEELDARIAEAQRGTQAELERLRAENHRRAVKETLTELEDKGLFPAVLEVVEPILLADETREGLITLSEEDGKESKLTATDIVRRVLDAIPADTLLKFSEPTSTKRFAAPATGEQKSAKELADEEFKKLHPELS